MNDARLARTSPDAHHTIRRQCGLFFFFLLVAESLEGRGKREEERATDDDGERRVGRDGNEGLFGLESRDRPRIGAERDVVDCARRGMRSRFDD